MSGLAESFPRGWYANAYRDMVTGASHTMTRVANSRVTNAFNTLSRAGHVSKLVGQQEMTWKLGSFLRLLFLNVLAAYAPGLLWVGSLPAGAHKGLIFLFSPVLLIALGTDDSLLLGWFCLGGFFVTVVFLSAVGSRSRTATMVIPCIVFAASLVQGLLVASVIAGIDAIGHSYGDGWLC